MGWLKDYFAKRRMRGDVVDGAKAFFEKEFPQDKMLRSVIAAETPEFWVVGISYATDRSVPPHRFFRVARSDRSVSRMPDDYWPPGWGVFL